MSTRQARPEDDRDHRGCRRGRRGRGRTARSAPSPGASGTGRIPTPAGSARCASTRSTASRVTTAGASTRSAAGAGPTIVLSHGVTIDSRVWVKQFEALPARGLRVVAFDHRGHGQSVTGASGHSIDNLGADLRTVLERLDLRDVAARRSLDGWPRAPRARCAPPGGRARPGSRHRAPVDVRADTAARRSRRVVRRRGSRAGSTWPASCDVPSSAR